MAVLTFIFSYIARQASNIVQAIFGWSIAALFGKLPRREQLLVIVALLLSLAWPALVLGAFLPNIASWAIAMVPLHKLIGGGVLRAIWIALAMIAPAAVGLLVRAAAPRGRAKTGALGAALHGYPMALGFFIGFVVVAVSVPIIKVASIVRGWTDEHVYVQPHEDQYDAVMRSLAEACARAGMTPQISDVPAHMQLATTVMRKFAAGAVTPFVPPQLRRVTSAGVQLYLYPADLLVRGEAKKISRIRAMLGRTAIDGQAYLVEDQKAKHVQDQLQRLHAVLRDRLERGLQPGEILATRLREVFRDLRDTDVSYADSALLEAMARRLERRLIAAGAVPYGTFPIDEEPDALPAFKDKQETTMPDQITDPLDDMSTVQLVSRTLDDAKHLVRTELELAKQDLRVEAKAAMRGAVELALAFSCALLVLASLVMATVLAVGHSKLALGFAVLFLVLGAIAGVLGYKAMPRQPLALMRTRVARDIDRLKEHMA